MKWTLKLAYQMRASVAAVRRPTVEQLDLVASGSQNFSQATTRVPSFYVPSLLRHPPKSRLNGDVAHFHLFRRATTESKRPQLESL